jgi:hypothetical protein
LKRYTHLIMRQVLKYFILPFFFLSVIFAETNVEHNDLRCYPTSWTAPNISGGFVTGSAPRFGNVVKTGPKLTINWINVEEKKIKRAVFRITYKKETKILTIGKEFELAGSKYLFIGADSKGYIIKDLKKKKIIKFRIPDKKIK